MLGRKNAIVGWWRLVQQSDVGLPYIDLGYLKGLLHVCDTIAPLVHVATATALGMEASNTKINRGGCSKRNTGKSSSLFDTTSEEFSSSLG